MVFVLYFVKCHISRNIKGIYPYWGSEHHQRSKQKRPNSFSIFGNMHWMERTKCHVGTCAYDLFTWWHGLLYLCFYCYLVRNRNPTKNWGAVRNSCFTFVIHLVTLVTNPVISHKWGKGRIMITTNGTFPYAFVKQIFVTVNLVIVVAVKLSKW